MKKLSNLLKASAIVSTTALLLTATYGFVNESAEVKFDIPSKTVLSTGGSSKLHINVTVPDGKHVYLKKRNSKSVSILTTFTMKPDSGFQVGEVTLPRGRAYKNDIVLYKSGRFMVEIRELGVAKPGTSVLIPLTVTTQACENDGSICYPPVTRTYQVRADIRKPQFLRRNFQARSNISWVTSYSDALSKAKSSGKNIYAIITAPDWCSACQYMERKAFTDGSVANMLNNNYVALRILDSSSEKNRFEFRGYPTSIIIDKNGKELFKEAGGYEAKGLLDVLEKYKQGEKPDEPVNPPTPEGPKIEWYTSSSSAFSAAAREKKNVYTVLTAPEWCTSCQWMETQVFSKTEIISRLTEDYIALKITDKSSEINNYDFSGYPTSVIFNYRNKQEVYRTVGATDAGSLAALLDKYKETPEEIVTEDATFHALLIADTHDSSIGDSVKADLDKLTDRVKTYASESGMELVLKTLEGSQTNNSNIVSAVRALNPGKNDTVMFYFSGHGYRTQQKDSRWPMMYIKGGDLDLQWVIDELKKKNARLMLAFSDSCNNYIDRSLGPDRNLDVSRTETYYKRLFAQTKGAIYGSASSPGEYAWGGSAGGAFTLKFIDQIDREASRSDANWDDIVSVMNVPIGSGKTKQSPQIEFKGSFNPTPGPGPDEPADGGDSFTSGKPTFSIAWNDRGSGANKDFTAWQPRVSGSHYTFGNVGTASYRAPAIAKMVAASGKYVKPPKDYILIWNDTGAGSSKNGAVWQPECERGYVPLGSFFTSSYRKPTPSKTRQVCLNAAYAKKTRPGNQIWKDTGSGAKYDLSVWSIQGSPYLHASSGYRKPNVTLYAIDYDKVGGQGSDTASTDFKVIWKDTGSGATHDVSIWQPKHGSGYVTLGHVIGNRHAAPILKTVPTLKSSYVKAPSDYKLIWKDTGSGATHDVAIWQPVCSSGYVALGMVATSNYRKPSRSTTVAGCVNSSYVKRSSIGKQLWNDQGSGAEQDVSFWAIEGSPYFVGIASWKKPSMTVYTLDESKLP